MSDSTVKERVRTALRSLGFGRAEAEHALAALDPTAWDRPIEALLREAIGLLT